jgi:CBS domain-containing protein
MYVDRHMSSPAVTIGEDTTLADARSILEEHGFRHLPVIDGEGSLRGIVTDRDIRSALPSRIGGAVNDEALLQRLGGTPVKEIMTPAPHSLTLSSTLDDALFVLEREKIGALPVVDGEGFSVWEGPGPPWWRSRTTGARGCSPGWSGSWRKGRFPSAGFCASGARRVRERESSICV